MPYYGQPQQMLSAFSPYAVTAGKDPYEKLGNGLQRWQSEMLGRNLGYTGDYGSGGHNAWLAADPTRQQAFQRGVTEFTDTDPNTNFGSLDWLMGDVGGMPRWQNEAINQYLGYQGGFGGGENNAWLAADPTRQQRYGSLRDVFGAFSALGKNPIAQSLYGGQQQYGMGAFGNGFGNGQPGVWSTGLMQPNITNNYTNTYQQQPFDYGFGDMFGGYGAGGIGASGWYDGSMGGAPWGYNPTQNSAGSLMFKHGGRVKKRPMQYADGGGVTGYASGGIPLSAIQEPAWVRVFREMTGLDPRELGLDPMTAMDYMRARANPKMEGAAPAARQSALSAIPDIGSDIPGGPSGGMPSMSRTEDVPGFGGASSYAGSPNIRPRPMMRRARPAARPAMTSPEMSGMAPQALDMVSPEQSGLAPQFGALDMKSPELGGMARQTVEPRMSGLAQLAHMLGLDREIGPRYGAWQGDAGPAVVSGYDNRKSGGRVGAANPTGMPMKTRMRRSSMGAFAAMG